MDSDIFLIPVILDPRCLDIKFDNNFKIVREKLISESKEYFLKNYINQNQLERLKDFSLSFGELKTEKETKYKAKKIIY